MEKFEHFIDPMTGIITQSGFVDDKLVTHTYSDCEPNLDYATHLRNADQYSSDGIKKGFFHVAHIPAVVVVEMLQNGVDVNQASAKEIVACLKRLNKEHLLTTRKSV
jgi:hypothetical protein